MNVGFYSGGRPNHSKTLSLLTFPVTFFIFIAASHARGADLVVGSDFKPTVTVTFFVIYVPNYVIFFIFTHLYDFILRSWTFSEFLLQLLII